MTEPKSSARSQLTDAELDEQARALPPPALSPDAAERIRNQLLIASESIEQVSRRSPFVAVAAVSASLAAAAVIIVWLLAGPDARRNVVATIESSDAQSPVPITRGVVIPQGSASYTLLSPSPDEVVRVDHGAVVVQVAALGSGERFRVRTTDAEVEVRGTVFFVQVDQGKLTLVRVSEGVVEVRPEKRPIATLHAGDSWPPPVAGGQPSSDGADVPPAETGPTGEGKLANAHRQGPRTRQPHERASAPEPALDVDSHAATDKTTSPPPAPSPGEEAFRQGWSDLKRNDAQAAARQFELACKQARAGSVAEDACFWAGAAAKRANQLPSARAALQRFLRRFPRSPRAGEASALLGWLLYDAGDIDRAEPLFRAAERDSVPRVVDSARRGLQAIARSRAQKGEGSRPD